MSSSHGDLFTEIGELVLAANSGEAIDLTAKSEELALRYSDLGLSEQVIAKAISRSIGAIGFSMAKVANADLLGDAPIEALPAEMARGAASLFPSGVRLAVLS